MRKNRVKIIYDEHGNTLYVRFSDKKEAYSEESEVEGDDVLIMRAEDDSVIGFEILNYLPQGTVLAKDQLPVEVEFVKPKT